MRKPKLAGPARNDLTVVLEKVKAEVHYFDRAYDELEMYGPPKALTPGPDEIVIMTQYGRAIVKKADEERWRAVEKLDD